MNIPQRDLSLESYPFKWKLDPVQLEMKIRSSIFTIAGVCAGLPALAWCVSDIIHHRKNGHRISVFIIILLLTDFLEFFLSPYILIKDLFLNEHVVRIDWTYMFLRTLLLSSRVCGFLLNQLTALGGILNDQLCTSSVFSSLGCIIFFTFVLLSMSLAGFQSYLFIIPMSTLFVFIVLLVLAFCSLLCSSDCCFHNSRRPNRHIWAVFFFSLLIYCSYSLFWLLKFFSALVHYIPVVLISLRLISDPLLCVLVCRQNLSLQTPQKPEEVQSEKA